MIEDKEEASENHFDVDVHLQSVLSLVKRGDARSSAVANETLRLLERVVTLSEWGAARELMATVRGVGRTLHAEPEARYHSAVANMVRRVLKVIRDEYLLALGGEEGGSLDPEESLERMIRQGRSEEPDFAQPLGPTLRRSVSANLREVMEENERSAELIAAEAPNHVHRHEVIMTFGYSRTVELFLDRVRDRDVEVLVVSSAPRLRALEFALSLKERGFRVSLIAENNKDNFMPVVNKVVVGVHAVLGNGGLKAPAGVHPLAVCANYHRKPFYVLAPLFKLTPEFVTSSDQEGFNYMLPNDMSFDDPLLSDVEIINPAFDYVPPDLVKLIIFNNGANPPSYVYRPLQELYHTKDHDFLSWDGDA